MFNNSIKSFKENNAVFRVLDLQDKHIFRKSNLSDFFTIFWNKTGVLNLNINDIPLQLSAQEMLFVSPYQSIQVADIPPSCLVFQYTREFYCIIDHEKEVSCAGLLFYNYVNQQAISLDEASIHRIETLETVLFDEFRYQDNLLGEMLRMLLKRLIIICTRLAKEQIVQENNLTHSNLELIRQFYLLVEKHFRSKHKVSNYADLMYKSPKTLSNTFAKHGQPSPSDIIQKRIIIEAKRLLKYTQKSSKEIAFELGFVEPANFIRYFKQSVGSTPKVFRKSL